MIIPILSFLVVFLLNGEMRDREPPPGTKLVGDIYIDQTEIANIHWMEYLHWEAKENGDVYIKTIEPDPRNDWFRDTKKRYEPISLITWEQAVSYCEWRTRVVNSLPKRQKKPKVRYRLPTVDEWLTVARYEYINRFSEIVLVHRASRDSIEKYPGYYVVLPQRHDDTNRIYRLFDNVSEMTAEKGIAVGASNYMLLNPEDVLSRTFKYDGPSRFLGFRCVAEFIQNP